VNESFIEKAHLFQEIVVDRQCTLDFQFVGINLRQDSHIESMIMTTSFHSTLALRGIGPQKLGLTFDGER
jgi:hypothetical protein